MVWDVHPSSCEREERDVRRRLGALLCMATVVAFAPPATGEQRPCTSVRIGLPPSITVDRPLKTVPVPLTRSCGATYVASVLSGRSGTIGVLVYRPARVGAVDDVVVRSRDVAPGHYALTSGTVRGGTARSIARGATVVKLGTYLGIAVSRPGPTVTVRVSARRYDSVRERMVPRPGVIGLQQRDPGSSRWTTRAFARAGATGDARFVLPTGGSRAYRAWFGPTDDQWGATSAVSVR
jgi:hypothetical protein